MNLKNVLTFILNAFILSQLLVSCSLYTASIKDHPIIKKEYWTTSTLLPLEQRITNRRVDKIEDYIKNWKKSIGINYTAPSVEKVVQTQDLKKAIGLLPKVLYNFLDANVAQIVIATNLGVPIVVSPLEDDPRFIILLDKEINAMGLNDWYLWREKSAFNIQDHNIQIESFLSYNNNKVDTLHFLLSQSLALIISYDEQIFPRDLEKSVLGEVPFIKHSWQNDKGVISSKYENILDEMKFVSFYGRSSKSFSHQKVYEFYRRLEKTNFTNLYSTTGPRRDFIESMAIFIHINYFQRPFTIDFYEREKLLDTFTHCLNLPRCLGKNKDIKKILDSKL